MAAKFPLQL